MHAVDLPVLSKEKPIGDVLLSVEDVFPAHRKHPKIVAESTPDFLVRHLHGFAAARTMGSNSRDQPGPRHAGPREPESELGAYQPRRTQFGNSSLSLPIWRRGDPMRLCTMKVSGSLRGALGVRPWGY